jgi:hypothetical protein
MDANTIQTAPSPADYRVLLPLGQHTQVLVTNTQEYAYLPQLVHFVKSIDILVNESNEAYWSAILKTLGLARIHPIKQLTKEYDLVFSDVMDQLPVRKGGTVCRFFKQRSVLSEKTPLQRCGAWLAWPDWPNFRLLIPDSPQGVKAAGCYTVPHYTNSSLSRIMGFWSPSWLTKVRIGEQGIILYRHGEKSAYPSPWEQMVEALSPRPSFNFLRTASAQQWLIGSDIAGNSHTVINVVDEKGCAQALIRCARLSDPSLALEEKRWETMINLLGSDLAEKLIVPGAMMTLDNRVVSAYRLPSGCLATGLRWRLLSFRNFVWAITQWLVKVAYKTAHPLPVSQFWEKHGLPLVYLRDRDVLPVSLKNATDKALVTLQKFSFRAFSVLEHGELSIQNVQIVDKKGQDFRILNWDCADLDGAPLVDLCYLLASYNAPTKLAAQCIGAYLDQTGYPKAIALPLWLTYVARRWQREDDLASRCRIPHNGEDLLRMTRLIQVYVQTLEKKAV